MNNFIYKNNNLVLHERSNKVESRAIFIYLSGINFDIHVYTYTCSRKVITLISHSCPAFKSWAPCHSTRTIVHLHSKNQSEQNLVFFSTFNAAPEAHANLPLLPAYIAELRKSTLKCLLHQHHIMYRLAVLVAIRVWINSITINFRN